MQNDEMFLKQNFPPKFIQSKPTFLMKTVTDLYTPERKNNENIHDIMQNIGKRVQKSNKMSKNCKSRGTMETSLIMVELIESKNTAPRLNDERSFQKHVKFVQRTIAENVRTAIPDDLPPLISVYNDEEYPSRIDEDSYFSQLYEKSQFDGFVQQSDALGDHVATGESIEEYLSKI